MRKRLWNLPDKGELESRREETFLFEPAGPGAFAGTIPRKGFVKMMQDPKQRRDFLDFCYPYGSNRYVCGMGKDNLFATGELQG